MSNRFIKLIDSEEADYLQEYHPNAFLLLIHIAKRARRTKGSPLGLEIGEALIGDYLKAGIETEMKYRTAKKILCERGHIKICETCRTRKSLQNLNETEKCKNATTKTTTKGTKVKILKSSICDINVENDNGIDNDRITTEQRPDNDEQERKNVKNEKKEKEKDKKEKFLEFVFLTLDEKALLVQKFGEGKALELIQRLNDYIGSKGVKYKSHYHTILNWHHRENTPALNGVKSVDRRTKNIDGTPVTSPVDGRF